VQQIFGIYNMQRFVFKVNGSSCSLATKEPSDLDNPVVARYVRLIPVHWVGASACLRMEFYGCTIKGKITGMRKSKW